jgi:hypothetical protein
MNYEEELQYSQSNFYKPKISFLVVPDNKKKPSVLSHVQKFSEMIPSKSKLLFCGITPYKDILKLLFTNIVILLKDCSVFYITD